MSNEFIKASLGLPIFKFNDLVGRKINHKKHLIDRARNRLKHIQETKFYSWNTIQFIRLELNDIKRHQDEIEKLSNSIN